MIFVLFLMCRETKGCLRDMINIKIQKDFVKTEIYAETLDNKHALHKKHFINLDPVFNF